MFTYVYMCLYLYLFMDVTVYIIHLHVFLLDNWPWDHIFKPNERGRTEVVCKEDYRNMIVCSY